MWFGEGVEVDGGAVVDVMVGVVGLEGNTGTADVATCVWLSWPEGSLMTLAVKLKLGAVVP